MWGIIAALALAPFAPDAPLPASSKWQVDYGEHACTASRTFGVGAAKVELLIERLPFGVATSVYLIADTKPLPNALQGPVTLASQSGPTVIADSAVVNNLADGRRVVRLQLPAGYVKALAPAATLGITGGGLRLPALQLDGVEPLTAALDSCERTFAKDLGIDVNALARIATPSAPIKPSDALRSTDYPHEAVRAEMEGDSYILWRIDTSGKPQDCRTLKSSGHEVLDRQACTVIMTRTRFVAAQDTAGLPVNSYMSRTIRWRLPTY